MGGKKEGYFMKFYSHDTDSFEDEKIQLVFIQFGYEGLGLFYTILEKLAKSEEPIKTQVLKSQLRIGKKLQKAWDFMEEIELISTNFDETFSKRLANFIESSLKKRKKTSKKILQWRENQSITKNVTGYNVKCNHPIEVYKDRTIEIDYLNLNAAIAAESDNYSPKINLEKEKKVSPKKEIQTTTHWKKLIDVWFEFYKTNHNGTEPSFKGQDPKRLKMILDNLQKRSEKNGRDWNEKTAAETFSAFLNFAFKNGWLKNNFLLSNLENQFDAIITTHDGKQQHSKGKQSGTDDYAAMVKREMELVAGSGGNDSGGRDWNSNA